MSKKAKSGVHTLPESVPPTVLTIFGATGDLSTNYLLPALYHMDASGLLPDSFQLVCVGRREFTTEQYLDFIVKKSSCLKALGKNSARKHFLKHLTYFRGDFEDPKSFQPLTKLLGDREKPMHICRNRLYYFATSPQLFSSLVEILSRSGLLTACATHERRIRVLVEKPFGFNLKSAHALNALLLKHFQEEQIYRIDHYLGKETVQNLMVVRFANSLFEPLWNRDHINHIELSVLYDDGVGQRAEFYDETGALRDIVQNHALQMLALIAMDEPRELLAADIRKEKLKVLSALVPFTKVSVKTQVVRGQYVGYVKDLGKQSETETYVAFKTEIRSPRWKGVPIYVRTGKNLNRKTTEISVHFKEPLRCLFRNCASNILTFRIQPDESVHLRLNNKIPGFGVGIHQGDYSFGYESNFEIELPAAYERLLLDFVQGDQRLFIGSSEIEAAWRFIDSLAANWSHTPLRKYKRGSAGPKEAEELIKKDLREWHTR